MESRICENCGKPIPAGSDQCNQCANIPPVPASREEGEKPGLLVRIGHWAEYGIIAMSLMFLIILMSDNEAPAIYTLVFLGVPSFIFIGITTSLIALIIKTSPADKKAAKQTFLLLVLPSVFGIFLFTLLGGFHTCPRHESVRRAACVANLDHLQAAFQEYAAEHGGEYPPIDNRNNNFIFEGNSLYPKYVSNHCFFACPSDPEYDRETNFTIKTVQGGLQKRNPHPNCITDMSYCYFGWVITNQEEAEAFFEAYDKMSPDDYDKDIIVPDGRGNDGGNIIYRMRSPEKLPPELKVDPANIPVIWDKPSYDITNFSHVPAGSNVLYLDGHVEFIRYQKEPKTAPFPVNHEFAKLLDERPRGPIPDCE